MKQRVQRSNVDDDENPYWISYSDLMSAMLFLFLLAIAVLIFAVNEESAKAAEALEKAQVAEDSRNETKKQLEAQIMQIASGEEIRSEMVGEIASALVDLGIDAQANDDGAVLSVPSSVLGFDGASYEIKDQYKENANELGKKISLALQDKNRAAVIDTITIEGHTDNVPHEGLSGTGNWGLSTFRAISLWQLWDSELQGKSRITDLTNRKGDYILSVSGYAETRPVQAEQASDKQRAKNRRIDIRFLLSPPKAEDVADSLESIMDSASEK